MYSINEALLLKVVCGLISDSQELWARVLKSKYKCQYGDWQSNLKGRTASLLWRSINKMWQSPLQVMTWAIGNGRDISFWNDKWTELEYTMGEVADQPIIGEERDNKVANYILKNGECDWTRISNYLDKKFPLYVAAMHCSTEDTAQDRKIWSLTPSGRFTAASAYKVRVVGTWEKLDHKWRVVWAWKGPARV